LPFNALGQRTDKSGGIMTSLPIRFILLFAGYFATRVIFTFSFAIAGLAVFMKWTEPAVTNATQVCAGLFVGTIQVLDSPHIHAIRKTVFRKGRRLFCGQIGRDNFLPVDVLDIESSVVVPGHFPDFGTADFDDEFLLPCGKTGFLAPETCNRTHRASLLSA
jgi:hypothetical protein